MVVEERTEPATLGGGTRIDVMFSYQKLCVASTVTLDACASGVHLLMKFITVRCITLSRLLCMAYNRPENQGLNILAVLLKQRC